MRLTTKCSIRSRQTVFLRLLYTVTVGFDYLASQCNSFYTRLIRFPNFELGLCVMFRLNFYCSYMAKSLTRMMLHT